MYNILTTGKGMLPPGEVIGNIEAKSIEAARKKLDEMCPCKGPTWDLEPVASDD